MDTLTDATQLSPAIGNTTDPVEHRTANQREAGQSSWVELCRYKRAFSRVIRRSILSWPSNGSSARNATQFRRQNDAMMT